MGGFRTFSVNGAITRGALCDDRATRNTSTWGSGMGTRLGIDTGGTFTDLIGIDDATNRVVIAKTASTPKRPVAAVMSAIERSGVAVAEIAGLSIGTTVA